MLVSVISVFMSTFKNVIVMIIGVYLYNTRLGKRKFVENRGSIEFSVGYWAWLAPSEGKLSQGSDEREY